MTMSASQLDRELEQALKRTENGTEPTAPAGRPSRRGNVGLLVVLLVMGAGIVALVMKGFTDAAVYSKDIDQAVSERGALMGRQLRLDGTLVHGSLQMREQPCEYRFIIKGKKAELPV